MTTDNIVSPSVIASFQILKEKILALHGPKARELAKKLEEQEKATSITIGCRLRCPNCSEIQRVVNVKEDPDLVAMLASGKKRGKAKQVPHTIVTLACGHERGEILPSKGVSFEDVPSSEADRLFPVDWMEVYKARMFRLNGSARCWF
jgi:hypothetical protein